MTETLQLILFLIGPISMFVGTLLLPRWFARSIVRHRLWKLRDDVADDILEGRLPYKNPAVRQFAQALEYQVHDLARLDIVDVWAFRRVCRRNGVDMTKAFPMASLAGLSESQRELLKARRDHMTLLSVAAIFSGSWIGVAHVVRFAVPDLLSMVRKAVLGRRRRAIHADTVLMHATESAVRGTTLGKRSRAFVTFKYSEAGRAAA